MFVIIDTSNLAFCLGKAFPFARLDYKEFADVAQSTFDSKDFENQYCAIGYTNQKNKGFITKLAFLGYNTFFPEEPRNVAKKNTSVLVTLSIFENLSNHSAFVICSSDPCLVPVVEYLRSIGKTVFIFACGIPTELHEICDGTLEISPNLLQTELTDGI